MPHKKCPSCETAVGVRTLKCGCGYEFHAAKKQEEPEVKKKEPSLKPLAQVAVVRHLKDPEVTLKEEAADLGYTIRALNKTGTLHQRFYLTKNISNHRYIGIFTETGKITGMYEA